MLRMEQNLLLDGYEFAGKIGDFFGAAIGRLLGGLGSIIVLIALLVVALIIAFDIKMCEP